MHDMLREAKNTTTCQSCTATQLVTTYFCVVCRRGLCSSCAGAGSRNSCPLVQCALCRRQDALSALRPTDDPAQRRHREVLLNATLEGLVRLEQALLSEATYTRHASNLRTWETYCEESGFAPYPATQTSISLFVPWALMVKNLNPCTVDLILGALSGWHHSSRRRPRLPTPPSAPSPSPTSPNPWRPGSSSKPSSTSTRFPSASKCK